VISLGTLKTWDSVNYQAGVQLAGSITTYLDNIPVARNIASSQMVTGRHVLVAIPEDNPKDAIVLAVWSSSGPSFGDHGELAGLGDDDHTQYVLHSVFDSHKARHDWKGADEVDIRRLATRLTIAQFAFENIDAWTLAVSGSGSGGWTSPLQYHLNTGTTINSYASLYTGGIGFVYPHRNTNHWFVKLSPRVTSDAIVHLFLVKSDVGLPPSLTSNHAGFKVINRRIWATNANGTTETETDTGVDWADLGGASLDMVGTGNSIKFYVGGVLKATHSTNLPSSWSYRLYFYITNTAAVDKQIWLMATNIFTP